MSFCNALVLIILIGYIIHNKLPPHSSPTVVKVQSWVKKPPITLSFLGNLIKHCADERRKRKEEIFTKSARLTLWLGVCCNGALMAVIGWLQVINAALALAAKPNSKVAQDNMDLFKEQWEKQVRVLTDAVDDITSIDDFLCVSGELYFCACGVKRNIHYRWNDHEWLVTYTNRHFIFNW